MKYLDTVPGKAAITSDVKRHVPNFIGLTSGDRDPSDTRPNEEVWQQVVGNIVSHRNESPENFMNRGLIGYDGKAWSLTPAGEAYLRKHNA